MSSSTEGPTAARAPSRSTRESNRGATSAAFSTPLSAATVVGTFRVQDTMTWDMGSLLLAATFDAAGTRGNVNYFASKSVATGPNSGEGFGLQAAVVVWVPAATDAGSSDANTSADGPEADGQADASD